MNPLIKLFTIRKCQLCDVQFSHFHHYFPETRGGEKTGSKSGIYLCPNHHHMANLLQIQIERLMVSRGCGVEELYPSDFDNLDVIFDDPFRAAIPHLLEGYWVGSREYLAAMGYFEGDGDE